MKIEQLLRTHDKIIPISPTENIFLDNTYFKMRLKGTSTIMYLREGVWMQLQKASRSLPSPFAFILYDTYRSLETQMDLFQYMYHYIKKHDPSLSEDQLLIKTRTFVADPYNLNIRHKLSHPTGAAIDLGLYNKDKKMIVDMGTPFDDPSEASATEYYTNSTNLIEKNFHQARSLLYQTMLNFEFTNYDKEWWHYDLGDYSWANKKQSSWYYSIIEKLNP